MRPALSPKTWYGMPAWANADGKVVCFLTPAGKFNSRYASFGFNDSARLDDGTVWPTSFAVTKLTKADEELFAGLIRKTVALIAEISTAVENRPADTSCQQAWP